MVKLEKAFCIGLQDILHLKISLQMTRRMTIQHLVIKLSRPTVAEINLLALKKNVKKLKKITRSKIYPVVKANAYGHGLRVIETINAYISGYCVATFEESIELRRLTNKSVVCMEGPYSLEELKILKN